MATIPFVRAMVIGAAIEATVIRVLVYMPWSRWLASTHFFIMVPFCFLSVSVLVGGDEHLADPLRRLAVELRVKFMMANTTSKGVDNLYFSDVRDGVPHLRETPDVGL